MSSMTSHTQAFPRDSYYFGGGMVFWENDRGEIEASENDSFSTGELLSTYGAEGRATLATLMGSYLSSRNTFLSEKLSEAKAMCPYRPGDTVRLKEPHAKSNAVLVEKVAGFLLDGEMSYALIGKSLKKDGTPAKGGVITTALDIQEDNHE